MRSVRVIVRGRVQGVGFRWFTRDAADARGITGWVRNLRDGSVEAELHGADAAVDSVLGALRSGPPLSRVDDISVQEVSASVPVGFEIAPTI